MESKIFITIFVLAVAVFARAETIVCEGLTNDINASENVKFQLEIKKDDKNPIFKNLGTFYKSTIKYFFSTGSSYTGIDIADTVSVRPNKIVFKGSVNRARNLTFSYSAEGTSENNAEGALENVIVNYDTKIINQPVQCEISGMLPQRPVCAEGYGSAKNLVKAIKASNDIDGIETAIECGANVNQADANGCTPLMFALEPACGLKNAVVYNSPMNKTAAILDVLTNNGAFVSVADAKGETPLIKAAKYGISDVYDTFIALEADFNAQDNLGNTALIYAVKNANDWIVEQILEGNPDRKLMNKNGKTAYDIAKQLQKDSIMDLVRIADANVIVEGHADGTCSPLRIELIQGQVIDLTLVATDRMFKFDSIALGLDLMADRDGTAKRTFAVATKGDFKFTCGFHGANKPSEGIISVK